MATMAKHYGLLALIAGTLVFLLMFNQRDEPHYRRNVQLYQEAPEDNEMRNYSSPVTIKDILKQQRSLLEQETSDLAFPPKTTLQNFTLATNGRPLRNIIITTWRSGSTFLGDVINSVPGNYYHYEPLLDYGIIQIRGPPHADSAIKNLKSLLMCDYNELDSYLRYGMTHLYLFTHNTRLWNQCELYPQFCWNPAFLSEFCKLFPFQSMKIVRLRLRLAEELLKDELLNVRILLLVRDPRGTLQSRKHRDWCPGEPDCDRPNLLCADMVSDYAAATRLQKLYPDRFRVIRYEDLSLQPYKHVKKLFEFFELDFHVQVINFLDSHTKLDAGGVSSTFRNSKSAPFHWRMDLNLSEIQYIEENCDQAMKLWGYVKVKNETRIHEFHPLTNYSVL